MRYRVAVVGSGPAGLYTADALVRSALDVEVDVIDHLPTPYGLVRYGVAPDHPRIKGIVVALERILAHDQVRFVGDVSVGRDLAAEELDALYDAVVYATGASRDRRLGIPGEDLPGSVAATDVVAWYSGHPDSDQNGAPLRLDTDAVVVVGAGNVALDVARLLARPAAQLHGTDMPHAVLDRLGASRVRDVHVVCRRGPQHARFTAKELRELGQLDDVAVRLDDSPVPDTDDDPLVAANLKVLRELALTGSSAAVRTIHLHFWRRPLEILGAGPAGVTGVRLGVVDPVTGEATGAEERVSAGAVVRAVGHRSVPVSTLAFDEELGRVPHDAGRVLDPRGLAVPGRYVAGWVKRGPSGVVGTNRACAADTVAALVADLEGATSTAAPAGSLERLLAERGRSVVALDGWLGIDAAERDRGRAAGRDRTKITDWTTLRRLGAPA